MKDLPPAVKNFLSQMKSRKNGDTDNPFKDDITKSMREQRKVFKIQDDPDRLLKHYPDLIVIKSIGFTLKSGIKKVFQFEVHEQLSKSALEEILASEPKGLVKVNDDICTANREEIQETCINMSREEIRETYINMSNVETVEIRYMLHKDKIFKS